MNSIIWNIGLSVFDTAKKLDNISIEIISKTKKFLIETLIEKIKPVVMGEL